MTGVEAGQVDAQGDGQGADAEAGCGEAQQARRRQPKVLVRLCAHVRPSSPAVSSLGRFGAPLQSTRARPLARRKGPSVTRSGGGHLAEELLRLLAAGDIGLLARLVSDLGPVVADALDREFRPPKEDALGLDDPG